MSLTNNIVHYFGSGTDFSYKRSFATSDRSEILRLMEERRQIPIHLKSALNDTVEGFTKTLDFLINAREILADTETN